MLHCVGSQRDDYCAYNYTPATYVYSGVLLLLYNPRGTCSSEIEGPPWLWSYGSWIYNYLCNQYLSPLMWWIRISTRAKCTTLCDKVCQWLATGRSFSPGPPISSTNKTDHHDITEILLKVALNAINQTNKQITCLSPFVICLSVGLDIFIQYILK